jgi:hypothetical protein
MFDNPWHVNPNSLKRPLWQPISNLAPSCHHTPAEPPGDPNSSALPCWTASTTTSAGSTPSGTPHAAPPCCEPTTHRHMACPSSSALYFAVSAGYLPVPRLSSSWRHPGTGERAPTCSPPAGTPTGLGFPSSCATKLAVASLPAQELFPVQDIDMIRRQEGWAV